MQPLSSAQLPSEYIVHHHPPPNPTIYTAKENSKVTQKSKLKYTFSEKILSPKELKGKKDKVKNDVVQKNLGLRKVRSKKNLVQKTFGPKL